MRQSPVPSVTWRYSSRRGKGKDTHDLLATVCDRFTERFDTSDPKEVKALLDKLES
jgi:hypothetical protein